MPRRSTAAVFKSLIVAGGLVLAYTANAKAQSNCQWYGGTALKQQQQNEKSRCGFNGADWHSDLGRHLAWCGSVPPQVWKEAAQRRDQMLAQCAAKAG